MSAKMTPTKRFVVRAALVTSTTLATIMGAQALASMDDASFQQIAPPPTQLVNQPTPTIAPETTNPANITAAAPNLVILRRAGEQQPIVENNAAPIVTRNSAPQITPPNAVQIAPPAPVIQQSAPVVQQSAPSTRSSR